MQFGEFEEKGLIVRTKVNFRKIYDFLSRSNKDLQTSMSNLRIDKEWSYTIAYHAMLRAGRALMMSFGYRPKGKDQHRTIIRFTNEVFGAQFRDLIREFDRMRRKRHDFIYEPNRPIPKQEVKHAINEAVKLVKQIFLLVEEKDPQKSLIIDFKENKG
jgi:uncharacterized protein (UPF0332 family)